MSLNSSLRCAIAQWYSGPTRYMFQKVVRQRLRNFLTAHATTARTLDIGSGGSTYGNLFPNRLTVDMDPARKPEIIADAHHLPFADGEFESVLCTEVLEHTLNPQQVVDECYRVLKPGGTLILTTRFVYPFHDAPHDYWRFTRSTLTMMFAKFSSTEITPEAGEFSTIAVLLQRIAFQTQVRGGKVTKFALFVVAAAFAKLDWLVIKCYGDIKKSHEVTELMSSGYYVYAKK